MQDATLTALCEFLDRYDRVVEVGVGRRPDVASALAAAGVDVTATDVRERTVPDGVRFVVDDVTDPTRSVYAEAEAIYACNLPAELQGPTLSLARDVGAAFHLTTLGAEHPVISTEPVQLPGETLHTAEPERP